MTKKHMADLTFRPSPLNAVSVVEAGRVTATSRERRKVVIYGAGLYKAEAPLDDDEWEVWALNLVPPLDARGQLRCDRWWDIHQRVAQTADDLRWIAKCPVPIYVPEDLQDASPNAIRYPLAEIVEATGSSYFSCTFAYQLALVLYEKRHTDVGLYGVELAWGTTRERTLELACTSYWIGRCQQAGIGIHLPENSMLASHCALYGFDYQAEIDEVRKYTDIIDAGDDERRRRKIGGMNAGG